MDQAKKRNILIAAAVICILLAGYQWGLVPVFNYRQELVREQHQAATRLQELFKLKERYGQVRQNEAQGKDLGQRTKGFSLFSYLEKQTTKDGVKEWVIYMRPTTQTMSEGLVEEQVQMRLENIRLAKLMDFLKHVEYAPEDISVKRAAIRSPKNSPGELQVDLVFVIYRVLEKS